MAPLPFLLSCPSSAFLPRRRLWQAAPAAARYCLSIVHIVMSEKATDEGRGPGAGAVPDKTGEVEGNPVSRRRCLNCGMAIRLPRDRTVTFWEAWHCQECIGEEPSQMLLRLAERTDEMGDNDNVDLQGGSSRGSGRFWEVAIADAVVRSTGYGVGVVS